MPIIAHISILCNSYVMKDRLSEESREEHIGMGKPLAEIETQINLLGEKISDLANEAEAAAKMGERERAASLEREKAELLREQRELLQQRAKLREHQL